MANGSLVDVTTDRAKLISSNAFSYGIKGCLMYRRGSACVWDFASNVIRPATQEEAVETSDDIETKYDHCAYFGTSMGSGCLGFRIETDSDPLRTDIRLSCRVNHLGIYHGVYLNNFTYADTKVNFIHAVEDVCHLGSLHLCKTSGLVRLLNPELEYAASVVAVYNWKRGETVSGVIRPLLFIDGLVLAFPGFSRDVGFSWTNFVSGTVGRVRVRNWRNREHGILRTIYLSNTKGSSVGNFCGTKLPYDYEKIRDYFGQFIPEQQDLVVVIDNRELADQPGRYQIDIEDWGWVSSLLKKYLGGDCAFICTSRAIRTKVKSLIEPFEGKFPIKSKPATIKSISIYPAVFDLCGRLVANFQGKSCLHVMGVDRPIDICDDTVREVLLSAGYPIATFATNYSVYEPIAASLSDRMVSSFHSFVSDPTQWNFTEGRKMMAIDGVSQVALAMGEKGASLFAAADSSFYSNPLRASVSLQEMKDPKDTLRTLGIEPTERMLILFAIYLFQGSNGVQAQLHFRAGNEFWICFILRALRNSRSFKIKQRMTYVYTATQHHPVDTGHETAHYSPIDVDDETVVTEFLERAEGEIIPIDLTLYQALQKNEKFKYLFFAGHFVPYVIAGR